MQRRYRVTEVQRWLHRYGAGAEEVVLSSRCLVGSAEGVIVQEQSRSKGAKVQRQYICDADAAEQVQRC